MPLQATSGAASYDGFGGGAAAVPNFIEDVFSTYLYTGNGSTQTINNGIDLSTKGGLVWFKDRTSGVFSHILQDTINGSGKKLNSNTSDALANDSTAIQSFLSNGFSIGSSAGLNLNTDNIVSWTFRKQPKFFDVVTWTGNDVSNRRIDHLLGSTPGCMFYKNTSNASDWGVWHRSMNANQNPWDSLYLNKTDAKSVITWFGDGASPAGPTSTQIVVNGAMNNAGQTYVAYLFAHDSGGFGLTGTDNVISCGSYTGTGALQTINLGYEAQFVMIKSTNAANDWYMFDVMRGFVVCPASGNTPTGDADAALRPNTSGAEQVDTWGIDPAPNGFTVRGNNVSPSGTTYIYIAIRRGPMKVPTLGTSVYQAVTRTGNSPTVNSITSVGFPPDSIWQKRVSGSTASANVFDRLIGRSFLAPATTNAETAANTSATRDLVSFDMTGFTVGEQWSSELNANTRPEVYWNFRRAPSFFDEVCYTGNGVDNRSLAHNLTAVPELAIVKLRNASEPWVCYQANLGINAGLFLNTVDAAFTMPTGNGSRFMTANPTSTTVTVSNAQYYANASDFNYVMYLFASVSGVSKVGSYTGNGSSQTINCGFTSGARFVMVKRTDATGNWLVVDTARGLVSAGDPTLYLNSTAAEITGADWIDPDSSGFIVNQEGTMNANVNDATYIFLSIA